MPTSDPSRSLTQTPAWRLPLTLLAVSWLLVACDDDDDTPPLTAGTIGAAGGTVATGDGSAVLTVPAGALAGDVSFRIDPGQISIVPGFVDVGPAYAFSPAGDLFAVPATVVVSYTPGAVSGAVQDDELRVGFRNSVGQVLGLVPLQVDPVSARVTVETTELGTFWVAAPDVVSAADLFPLNDGDVYRYDSGLVLTVSHTSIEPNFGPATIVRLTFASLGSTTGLYFEANAPQLRQLGSFDIAVGQERFDSPVLWIDSRDSIGTVRPVVDTYFGYRPFGITIVSYTGIAEVTTRLAERESVATVIGSFETVRTPVTTAFTSTVPSWGEDELEFWFAAGVGPVQIRMRADLAPVRLVEATVGGQPVEGN